MSIGIDKKNHEFLRKNIKGLMQDTLEWMEQRNAELRKDAGVNSTPAEAKLFASLRGEPRSISELARALGVSRQAVHATTKRLIAAGVVELTPHPSNRRDKLVTITQRGDSIRNMAANNIRVIEAELANSIGSDNLELLRAFLSKHLENQIE